MATEYPIETVLRAFALFLDYVPLRDIPEILADEARSKEGVPSVRTLEYWSTRGEGIDHTDVSWSEARDIVEAKRARVSYEREIGEREALEWEDMQHEISHQLRDTRNRIYEKIEDGAFKAKPADLKAIADMEQQIHGEKIKRIEITANIAHISGAIVAQALEAVFPDEPNRVDRALDLIGENFDRFISGGGDPDLLPSEIEVDAEVIN